MGEALKKVGAVILAAGKGTRLNHAELPKVMAPIGGRPILDYIITTLEKIGFSPERISVVVNHKKEKIKEFFKGRVCYAEQTELLGTAHAAFTGMRVLPSKVQTVLVMGGDDSAFYTEDTIVNLTKKHLAAETVLTLLTTMVNNPEQLGRIVRHEDGGVEIIEKEYLTPEQKLIKEISTGTFVFDRVWFEEIFPNMPQLRKLAEFGLPTALAMAREAGQKYQVIELKNPWEWFGVNTPDELVEANKRKQL